MPYFECTVCGTMINLGRFEQSALRQECPECSEETLWEAAFEGEGVSF